MISRSNAWLDAQGGGLRLAKSFLIGFAAVALASNSANAGIGPGQSSLRSSADSEFWWSLRELGACLVLNKRSQADALMQTAPGSTEETKILNSLMSRSNPTCLRRVINFSMERESIRGAVAEGLIDRAIERGDFGPAARLVTAVNSAAANDNEIASLRAFADCYVAAHPAKIVELFSKTRLAEPEEKTLVSAMAADFGKCLPEGLTLRADATRLRFLFAEAAYRRSRGQTPQLAEK